MASKNEWRCPHCGGIFDYFLYVRRDHVLGGFIDHEFTNHLSVNDLLEEFEFYCPYDNCGHQLSVEDFKKFNKANLAKEKW